MHEIDHSQRFPIIKLEFSSEISGISFPKNLTRKRYVMQKNHMTIVIDMRRYCKIEKALNSCSVFL
ncbi:hypothetical protein J4462_04255 [Candidatus Pacearchaeota archaeon]|nr:hypothetical protein [Candidatus Pacearchaeota archaeon]